VPPVELFPSVLILPRSSPKGPVYDAICLCRTRSGKPVKVTFDAVPDGLSAEVRDRTQPDDGSALIHVRCDPNKLKQLIRKGRQPIRLRASDGGGQVALTLSVSVAPGR
jgi:hypothetical protein